jgi:hypothetical protein
VRSEDGYKLKYVMIWNRAVVAHKKYKFVIQRENFTFPISGSCPWTTLLLVYYDITALKGPYKNHYFNESIIYDISKIYNDNFIA